MLICTLLGGGRRGLEEFPELKRHQFSLSSDLSSQFVCNVGLLFKRGRPSSSNPSPEKGSRGEPPRVKWFRWITPRCGGGKPVLYNYAHRVPPHHPILLSSVYCVRMLLLTHQHGGWYTRARKSPHLWAIFDRTVFFLWFGLVALIGWHGHAARDVAAFTHRCVSRIEIPDRRWFNR